MHAAMHIGVSLRIGALHGVDHHLRLLGRGAAVEEGERLAMHFAAKNREVATDFFNVIDCHVIHGYTLSIQRAVTSAK